MIHLWVLYLQIYYKITYFRSIDSIIVIWCGGLIIKVNIIIVIQFIPELEMVDFLFVTL